MQIPISDIKFDASGLIPAIVQDAETKEVLMLAYMNRRIPAAHDGKRRNGLLVAQPHGALA